MPMQIANHISYMQKMYDGSFATHSLNGEKTHFKKKKTMQFYNLFNGNILNEPTTTTTTSEKNTNRFRSVCTASKRPVQYQCQGEK